MLFIADLKAGARKDWMLHALPTVIVFLAFLGVTLWSWQASKARVADQRDHAISQETTRIESQIADRISDYQQILESANGFFQASSNVSRSEWRTFYENYDIPRQLPGLQGIAFAERVPRDQLENHQNRVRAEGFRDYAVTPPGDRAVYVPIVYPITPVTPANYKSLSGFGFDISTDPARNAALEKASSSGKVAMTGKLVLSQDEQNEPAFILYQPLYQSAAKQTVAGFAYAPFTTRNFFEGIFGPNAERAGLGFRVYDQTAEPENVMFENQLFSTINEPARQQTLHLAGRDWVIEYKAPNNIVSAANRRNPTTTLIAGVIFSALIAGLVLSLLLARTRSLAFAENRELAQAKDDLLSIASHQLRTPATGVKQYIGMLLEGYAGKITPKQRQLLKEAYSSNERQLGIIDEILHVARIDTGRLVLQTERLKIRDLIDQSLRDHAADIKAKKQVILTSFPKKILYANGDPQYVRMAVDNIISNAIKYTPEHGTITVKIKRHGDFAAVSVADTGVGIARDDLDKLFQKFSRISNELSRQTAGSGVGLYIAKQIIEMHGGTITAESEEGQGTTFTFMLPLALRSQVPNRPKRKTNKDQGSV